MKEGQLIDWPYVLGLMAIPVVVVAILFLVTAGVYVYRRTEIARRERYG